MEDDQGLEDSKDFCCTTKHYLSQKNNIADTLEIHPRVVVSRKHLKLFQSFEQLIHIKNGGLYPRKLTFGSDSCADTEIRLLPKDVDRYIEPEEVMAVRIVIQPNRRALLNRVRHVYIESRHPNIVFEIPIIIVQRNSTVAIPDIIAFPSSIWKTKTYYEFSIYNPTAESVPVIVKPVKAILHAYMSSNTIRKKSSIRILLKLFVKDYKPWNSELKIKFGNMQYLSILLEHTPKTISFHISMSHVNFQALKFEREAKQDFTICNESHTSIQCKSSFLTLSPESSSTQLTDETDDQVEFPLVVTPDVSMNSFDTFFKTKDDDKRKSSHIQAGESFKHFNVEPKGGILLPNSCTTFSITFRPVLDEDNYFDDNVEPPFLVRTKAYFTVMNEENTISKYLSLSGFIDGPEVEVNPTNLDVRKLFLGEEYCNIIKILNVDGKVNAKVVFKEHSNSTMVTVTVDPCEGLVLDPCQTGIFKFSLFSLQIGKFVTKLRFKVKNGATHNVLLRGVSQALCVRAYPDMIELGSIPFGIPQKRQILLVNPLSVPIALRCYPTEDGYETPLVLNIRDVREHVPLTIKNPTIRYKDTTDKANTNTIDDSETVSLTSRSSSTFSYHSMLSDNSSYSTTFENEVLDPIGELANTVVFKIKQKKKFAEKPEAERHVLEETLDCLMNLPYFKEMTNCQNYAYVDWNAIPTEPRELYVDTEIIYLKPNTGRNVTLLLVPNTVGYHNRTLDLRICPIDENSESDGLDRTVIPSDMMISKLWIEYNCRIPEIIWQNFIELEEDVVYAGQKYRFDMEFHNNSNVGGFIYYDVVPDCKNGYMYFVHQIWKFFIASYGFAYAYCGVVFRAIGNIKLTGIIKFLGYPTGLPYEINAYVLPTRISASPKCIYHRQSVLKTTKLYVYIENVTPTITPFSLYLKHDTYQYIQPLGAILGPTGQGMYVTIITKFYDPEIFKNVLYINMPFGRQIKVPITVNIEDMPIFFKPNIREGLNAGCVLTATEEHFANNILNYSKAIRVRNHGKRSYSLTINVLKSGKSQCAAPIARSRLSVEPKTLCIEPGGEEYIHVHGCSCQEIIMESQFRVRIVDQINKQRVQNILFVASIQFCEPRIVWNRHELVMEYPRTHKFLEHTQIHVVELINAVDVAVDRIHLKVLGPFKVKDLFEHRFKKAVTFSIDALEKKEITIILLKSALKDKCCTRIDGRIICIANDKVQRSLFLKVRVLNPAITITEPTLLLFTRNKPRDVYVEIENTGCLEAPYKWKKLGQSIEYVAKEDDSYAFAREILSEIFQMLDISELSEGDFANETNMTLRFQHYRCALKALIDPIGVREILDEIVNNLDLTHKRYVVKLDEDDGDAVLVDDYDYKSSSETHIKHTVDHILDLLKLEDSYEVSSASSMECIKERVVYFDVKESVIGPGEKQMCLLHLPGVRKGYQLVTSFMLDVVGGLEQPFEVILVNLSQTIRLSRQSIYLGIRPWYELYKTQIKIKNITQYTINIEMDEVEKAKSQTHQLSAGYVKITTDKCIHIDPYGTAILKVEGITGFSEYFLRSLHLTVNESDHMQVRLRAQGIMPLFIVKTKLGRAEQLQEDIVNEFIMLQRIYYFDMFRSITEEDDDWKACQAEEECKETMSVVTDDYSISTTTDSSTSSRSRDRRFFRLMKSYVLVNNNEELPNATILEQLLETEKFLQCLKVNADTRCLLQLVYEDYLKITKAHDELMPINLKHFTVQPLPFERHGHILAMKELTLSHIRKFHIILQFFGPGKLIAAARTAVKIPGLLVDFDVDSSDNKEFIYYKADHKAPDLFDKPYRNMFEREMDLEDDPKVKHAHSFDINREMMHQRNYSAKERKNVENYYNSLNKSVYMEHKHHYILCKIFSNSKHNFTDFKIHLRLVIKPEAKFYEVAQMLEDYLYIDLHMGPTLPILLRGMIAKP